MLEDAGAVIVTIAIDSAVSVGVDVTIAPGGWVIVVDSVGKSVDAVVDISALH